MKKQIRLTFLGILLFAGIALYTNDSVAATTETTSKTEMIKQFISKSGISLKSIACNRYFQVGAAVVAVAAVGCYIYKLATTEHVENQETN